MSFGKSDKDQAIRLRKAIERLERKIAKLPEKAVIQRQRLLKSYEAKDAKLRKLTGEPVKSDLQDKIEDKKLEDIPESAW
jgi:hypothetical protein